MVTELLLVITKNYRIRQEKRKENKFCRDIIKQESL